MSKATRADRVAQKALDAFDRIVTGLTEAAFLYDEAAQEAAEREASLLAAAAQASDAAGSATEAAANARTVASKVSDLVSA